jgi:HEAT repeat protein
MTPRTTAAALAATLLGTLVPALAAQRPVRPAPAAQSMRPAAPPPAPDAPDAGATRGYRTTPPPARAPQDPADSLYREARTMLNRASYSRAAFLFAQIHERHPRSSYAADAYYWEAYALSRTGSTSGMNRALAALRLQAERHPDAATRTDADNLATRIRGQLARRGDAEAAREVETMARSLADAGRPGAAPGRASAGQTRRAGRCAGDDDERMAALNALLQMDSDRALPILEKVLARRDEGSVCLRRRAVFLVSQQQSGSRAESMLLGAARSDPDAEVREQAVFWLSQVDSDRAVAALDSILRGAADPGIREKAIFALAQQGSPLAGRALRDFARRADAPASLREHAIFWLGQSGGAEATAFLRSLYGAVTVESLKEKILFSVAQGGDREGGRWLLEIATSSTEPIRLRKSAVFWAAQGDADLPALLALYDRTSDREMKEHLIFAYAQNGRRAAVDRLIQIARRDPDPELRKKALFWLSQSSDPRVADLLAEILDRPS